VTSQLNIEKSLGDAFHDDKPSWFKQWQQEGRESFSKHVWPTRKTENWKYTSLKSLTDIHWSQPSSSEIVKGVVFESWNECKITIVNGVIQGDVSLPEGVTLKKLSDCDEEAAKVFFAKLSANKSDFLFDDLNQSVLTEGYWLSTKKGVNVSQPIHLNFVVSGENALVSSQVLVDVEQSSSLTIAETYSATENTIALVNGNACLCVGENAQLTHYHLLLEEGDVRHIGRVAGTLSRFAQLASFHMAVGGVLKRKDITIRHCGEGAQLSLNGVYLPKGNEVIDYHTTLEHEVPNCTSEEIFRGIIADHAKAVFNGRIHIHKDAQKSLAEMNNRNLLLSDHAEINTKPELEIYADDVKCAHGATIAQLDDSLLFYFQARGISKAEAEVMLSFGFVNELLDGLKDEPVQQLLRPLLATLFSQKKADLSRHLL
jgi:Fe-S cluster assembly protein SufD